MHSSQVLLAPKELAWLALLWSGRTHLSDSKNRSIAGVAISGYDRGPVQEASDRFRCGGRLDATVVLLGRFGGCVTHDTARNGEAVRTAFQDHE